MAVKRDQIHAVLAPDRQDGLSELDERRNAMRCESTGSVEERLRRGADCLRKWKEG